MLVHIEIMKKGYVDENRQNAVKWLAVSFDFQLIKLYSVLQSTQIYNSQIHKYKKYIKFTNTMIQNAEVIGMWVVSFPINQRRPTPHTKCTTKSQFGLIAQIWIGGIFLSFVQTTRKFWGESTKKYCLAIRHIWNDSRTLETFFEVCVCAEVLQESDPEKIDHFSYFNI